MPVALYTYRNRGYPAMAVHRDQAANPTLLPDATYFALRRMTAAKEAVGEEAPACRGVACVTNRAVEFILCHKLGWVTMS